MFALPVTKETMPFASLIGGGSLLLRILEDADKPFDEQVARGDARFIDVSFDTARQNAFKLGARNEVKLTLGAGTEALLDIIWPDEPEEQRTLLQEFGLAFPNNGQIYLAFTSRGRAELGAEATFPSGALSATFGIGAGGEVAYTYLKPFDRNLKAGEVLRQFFRGMRLPYDVDAVDKIPEEGEVLYFRYGGYLTLGAAASWGYAVSKYHGLDLHNLSLAQKIDITSAVSVRSDVRIAGQHGVELRRGAQPGWVRVVVRKHREGAFSLAADIGIRTELETRGLPEDANQFLEAVLDLRTPDVVAEVANLLHAGPEAFFNRLEAEAGGLLEKLLDVLSRKWFNKALSSEGARALFERLQTVLRTYEDLRQVDEKAAAVLETYAGQDENLKALIGKVLSLPDREELQEITDSRFWDFLQQYLGDTLFAFLTSDETFEAVRQRLAVWKEKGWEDLLAFIEARQEAFDLNTLLGALDGLLGKLEQFDTPEELRDQAEVYLLDLAHRLTGKAFDQLSGSPLREELEALRSLLGRLEDFKDRLYAQFTTALNHTHKLNLSWSYAQAREKAVLMDVEINLQQGSALLRHALHGDFAHLAHIDDPELVRIHPSLFTARLRSANTLKVDVLGWKYEWLRELVFHTEETVRPQGDGLLHVYHLKAEEQISRRKRDEEIKMQFLFGLMAEGRRPDLIDTVSRLSVDYGFDITDPKTSEQELRAYLRLAEHLKMLPEGSIDGLLETFRGELNLEDGAGWGAVTVNYQVRYDPEAVLGVFRFLPDAALRGITRQAFRNITSANYRNFGGSQYEALSKMILDDRIYWTWKTREAKLNAEGTFCYEVAGEKKQKACLDKFRRNVLHILYEVEDDLVQALLDLDDVLDRAREGNAKPGKAELEKTFQRLVKQRRTLEKWLTMQEGDRYVNPFFAVLDQLISVLSGARATRATMQITFKREHREPVTKVLVASAAV